MSVDEQLKRWVDGESVHNSTRDECTPDFSCCKPQLLAPKEIRMKFLNANQAERSAMLAGFLGVLLRGHSCEVVS